jgi:hypothetical protein
MRWTSCLEGGWTGMAALLGRLMGSKATVVGERTPPEGAPREVVCAWLENVH